VRISLLDFGSKKYSIKFYEDDDTFLFELKDIKEASLMLEKSNFITQDGSNLSYTKMIN
jgi:hypothetical protein